MASSSITSPAGRDPRCAVAVGLLGLASAMGIGRFAFTPLLPLMQADGSVTLAEGGSLAAANYLGYLAGALVCLWLPLSGAAMARTGLLAVAVLTLAMGFGDSFAGWLAWRALAGAASAFVLVGVSAWSLAALAEAGRSAWAGWVFAGVGIGIALAGLVGLGAGIWQQPPQRAWIALGVCAALVSVVVWSVLQTPVSRAAGAAMPPARSLDAVAWRLVVCYGFAGFGYILPATFLPAAARELFADPARYGWTWPLFGLAAAASTLAAARLFRDVDARRLWAASQLVMALGVLAPALSRSGWALLASAVCVGGTFMVLTMAAMQAARDAVGAAAPRLIAAMTAAFATGQLLGPLTVSALAESSGVPIGPYLLATALLVLGTPLLRRPSTQAHPVPASSERTSP